MTAGNGAFFDDLKIDTSKLFSALQLDTLRRRDGKTIVYVAIDGRLAGALALRDSLRPGAAEVVAALHELGKEVWMISGDHRDTCRTIAARVGIPPENVIAEVSPIDKANQIEKLQDATNVDIASSAKLGSDAIISLLKPTEEGKRTVMMVGDGINDSVALGQADVGVAMGNASDVSLEAADVVLMSDDLTVLLRAFEISTFIVRQINFNVTYATLFNIIAVPIAAGVFFPWRIVIPPAFAGLSELLSSLPVIAMSFIIIFYKPSTILDNDAEIRLMAPQLNSSGLVSDPDESLPLFKTLHAQWRKLGTQKAYEVI